MNSKSKLYRNTPEEEAEIQRGIDADPDTFVPSDEQFARMRPLGRPRLESPKVQLTVRYDADIVEAFKATGDGWQTRMNDALREWLKTHRAA
ncbi:hypothetical protein AWB66_03261 [Caballeronia telluris]|uniref:BrnA antitoxin of type II toxin-antitoxin system n=1 Tax=Caballeronia telluris TaxID=326475 RepID=A0A158IPB0_9BURK|nr:hypothetical protein AWB66_03205 [Caballeronia telluris]SAL58499.1 hypothetical protein AWB66_03261 [Caballeronia telluris]